MVYLELALLIFAALMARLTDPLTSFAFAFCPLPCFWPRDTNTFDLVMTDLRLILCTTGGLSMAGELLLLGEAEEV